MKLRRLRPDLYGLRGLWKLLLVAGGRAWPERVYIEEQLQFGDSRAAVVMSTDPLLVAAYTDELDCVAMLRFPPALLDQFNVSIGDRLLTVNAYGEGPQYDSDLILGPRQIMRWKGFHPLIADFICDNLERVVARKQQISEDEWRRTERMGQEYLVKRPGLARDGRPVYAISPAVPPE